MGGESEIRRRRLEELKELFGPAFGPALEAYGRSFAERLLEDERWRNEVRERFDEGRARGRFPALSKLLAGASHVEREEFFRTGWVRVVFPQPARPKEPWDYAPWDGNLDAYREDLYGGMAFAYSDLRAFAQEWLEELARVGYYGTEESLELPLKQQAGDLSAIPRLLPLYGEAYPVRFGAGRQVLWLRLDVGRSERGYRNVSVSDEPLRTDRAILAALTALEGRPLDTSRLSRALRETTPSHNESAWDLWVRAVDGRGAIGEPLSGATAVPEDLQHHQALDYVLSVLRHHRPDFDDLPREEKAALMVKSCAHVNEFLESLRKLVAFLEHGTPGCRTPAARKMADRDVAAAIFRDVDRLTYREIGEEIGVQPPDNFDYKGDHPTVRKMVGRGRDILKRALGEEGWWSQVEAMRAEAERWLSLSGTQREAEAQAEALGIPYEEALKRSRKDEARARERNEPGIA